MKLYTLLLFAIVCIGCAPSLRDARFAVDNAAYTYSSIEPGIEKRRREEGDACFFDVGPPGAEAVKTCIDTTRARWAPVRAAAYALHAAILAAQSAVGAAEVAAALGGKPDLVRVFAVIYRAVDAAATLDAAVVSLVKPTSVSPVPAVTSPRPK